MGVKSIFTMKSGVLKCRTKHSVVLKGSIVLAVLLLLSSSTALGQSALEETDAPADTGIEGIDQGLLTDVAIASLDFAGELTQEINISKEGSEGEDAIDNLITLMQIGLAFTADVIDSLRARDTNARTEEETNLTLSEAGFVSEEGIEDAFLYLRLLQSGNLCEEAIDLMEAGGPRTDDGLREIIAANA